MQYRPVSEIGHSSLIESPLSSSITIFLIALIYLVSRSFYRDFIRLAAEIEFVGSGHYFKWNFSGFLHSAVSLVFGE